MLRNLLAKCEAMSSKAIQISESHRWFWLGISLPVVLAIHIFAASHIIAKSNQDLTRADQGAEIWLAKTTKYHNDLWPQRSDGVRNPMWSFIARFVESPADEQFFKNGKWLNTGIACVFLAVLGVIATASCGGLAATNVLLLSSLGIFLVRAAFFQPEPLYYAFSFFAAIAAWKILRSRGWIWYPVFGFLAGLAYLSKPSFEPFVLAFLIALGVRTLMQRSLFPPAADVGGVLGLFVIMIGMTIPLGMHKAEAFGSPTFSYPKIWMWMDDFDNEAWPWQDAHPGRVQLEKVPPQEVPSLGWYFRRHSLSDAISRTYSGTKTVLVRFFFPEPRRKAGEIFWKQQSVKSWEQPISHRGTYLIILGILPLALLVGRKLPAGVLTPQNVACAAFALSAFGIYALLYGWYYPIGRGDRFMGSLWVPFVFLAAVQGFNAYHKTTSSYRSTIFFGTHLLILVSLLLQALNLVFLLYEGIVIRTRN